METAKTRAVIIVCQEIEDAQLLRQSSEGWDIHRAIYGLIKETTPATVKQRQKLQVGVIVVATFLASRGIDFRCFEKLYENGGIHVIMTVLAAHQRGEEQVFGRTARCGFPGSGQLILNRQKLEEMGYTKTSNINEIKEERKEKEKRHYEHFKKTTYLDAQLQDELFAQFRQAYTNIRTSYVEHRNISFFKTTTHIIGYECRLKQMLESWGFWLDKTVKKQMPAQEAKQQLTEFLKKWNNFGDERLMESPFC
uniref:SecA family profile domain-containing protein n=1 Tax=Ditylenchus dipsaci TaxID=166011 RepID=A0A915EI11_9BILA